MAKRNTCHLVAAGTRISCQTKTVTVTSDSQQQTLTLLMQTFRSSLPISDRNTQQYKKLIPVLHV